MISRTLQMTRTVTLQQSSYQVLQATETSTCKHFEQLCQRLRKRLEQKEIIHCMEVGLSMMS